MCISCKSWENALQHEMIIEIVVHIVAFERSSCAFFFRSRLIGNSAIVSIVSRISFDGGGQRVVSSCVNHSETADFFCKVNYRLFLK